MLLKPLKSIKNKERIQSLLINLEVVRGMDDMICDRKGIFC